MVTPTEKARRSEALYYDNHNITRRTLCDRVVNLEADMEEIKAENAKLREFASEAFSMAFNFYHGAGTAEDLHELKVEYYKLGVEAS